jgi:hypothetical protein
MATDVTETSKQKARAYLSSMLLKAAASIVGFGFLAVQVFLVRKTLGLIVAGVCAVVIVVPVVKAFLSAARFLREDPPTRKASSSNSIKNLIL